MTPQCLIFLGITAFIQFIFHLIELLTTIGGRNVSHMNMVNNIPMDDGIKETVQVITSSHIAFFDSHASWNYNLRSAMLIITPAVLLLTMLLSYHSCQEFPSPFDDPEEGWPQDGPAFRGNDYAMVVSEMHVLGQVRWLKGKAPGSQ